MTDGRERESHYLSFDFTTLIFYAHQKSWFLLDYLRVRKSKRILKPNEGINKLLLTTPVARPGSWFL